MESKGDKRVLYFIEGMFPTEQEANEAISLNACIRNANAVSSLSPIEKCSKVYGKFPESYKHLSQKKECEHSKEENIKLGKPKLPVKWTAQKSGE